MDDAAGMGVARLHRGVLLAVFGGGCVGGWARYGITSTSSAGSRFPWATFAVNTAGAFVLGLVVVAAARRASSGYLRPLLGTGFCGAFTTFSSVVVTADRLFAHRHGGLAVGYVLATIAGGLLAGWLGLVLARAVVADRHGRDDAPGGGAG